MSPLLSLFFILCLGTTGTLASKSQKNKPEQTLAIPEDRRVFIHAVSKIVSTLAFSTATAGVLSVRMPDQTLQTAKAQASFALSRSLFEAATQILKRGWPVRFSTKEDRRLSFDAAPQVLLQFDEKNKPGNLKEVNEIDKAQAGQLKDAFWAAMGRKNGDSVQCKLKAQFQREAHKRRLVLSEDQLANQNAIKDSGFQAFKFSLDHLTDLPGRCFSADDEDKKILVGWAKKYTKGVQDFAEKVKEDAGILSFRLVLKGSTLQGNWVGNQAMALMGLWTANQISELDLASDNFVLAILENMRGQITKRFLVLNDAVGGFQSMIHDPQTKTSFQELSTAIDEFKLAVETEEKQFRDHVEQLCKKGHLIRI